MKTFKKYNFKIWLFVVVTAFPMLLLFLAIKSVHPEITENELHINGPFSKSIELNKLDSIKIVDELPKVERLNNGEAFFGNYKGHFKCSNQKYYYIYATRNNRFYICLYFDKVDPIYLGFKAKDELKIFYNRIIN